MRWRTPLLAVRPTSTWALVAWAALVLLAGCGGGNGGGDEAADTTRPAPTATAGDDQAGGDVCRALRKVADLDQRTKQLVAESADWDRLQRFLIDETPTALAAYDEALRSAPADVSADIRTLRDFTAKTTEAAEDSDSATDWASKAATTGDASAAAAAGERLNAFTSATCGFSVS